MTTWLVYSLTRLDLTQEENMLLFVYSESVCSKALPNCYYKTQAKDIQLIKTHKETPGQVVMWGDSFTDGPTVRFPVPYTGWTLVTFICCKNCNVFLKKK